MTGVRRVVAAVAVVPLLGGCGSHSHVADAPPSHETTVVELSADHRAAVDHVVATVRRYLATWQRDGGVVAGSRYLSRDQRPPAGTPRSQLPDLVSGTVTGARLDRWHGRGDLVVEVFLRLHVDGSGIGWGEGTNDRFVTARLGRDGRYRLSLATGP